MMDEDNEQPVANANHNLVGALENTDPYYGSYIQNVRGQAIQLAHNHEVPFEDVVARADAYAKFIVG